MVGTRVNILFYIFYFIFFLFCFGGKASTDRLIVQKVAVMHQLYGCQPPLKKEEEEEDVNTE